MMRLARTICQTIYYQIMHAPNVGCDASRYVYAVGGCITHAVCGCVGEVVCTQHLIAQCGWAQSCNRVHWVETICAHRNAMCAVCRAGHPHHHQCTHNHFICQHVPRCAHCQLHTNNRASVNQGMPPSHHAHAPHYTLLHSIIRIVACQTSTLWTASCRWAHT